MTSAPGDLPSRSARAFCQTQAAGVSTHLPKSLLSNTLVSLMIFTVAPASVVASTVFSLEISPWPSYQWPEYRTPLSLSEYT